MKFLSFIFLMAMLGCSGGTTESDGQEDMPGEQGDPEAADPDALDTPDTSDSSEDAPADPEAVEEADVQADADDPDPDPDPIELPPCDPGPGWNLEDCPCPDVGDARECWLGNPDPASICSDGGLQVCADRGGGAHLWGECLGATPPEESDPCFDFTDSDCDTIVDQTCPCTDDVNLCEGLNGSVYNVLVYPSYVRAGVPFYVFLVTTLPFGAGVNINLGGGYCAGRGLSRPCPSPGSACAGWNVMRFEVNWPTAGPLTIYFYIDEGNPPCNSPVDRQFTVNLNP